MARRAVTGGTLAGPSRGTIEEFARVATTKEPDPSGERTIALGHRWLDRLLLGGAIALTAIRLGHPALAASLVTGLLLVIAIVVALAIPAAVAQPSILAVLGFVVARQYVRGRALVALAVVCWLVSVAAVTTMLAASGLGDSWLDYAFGVGPISVALATLYTALTLFAVRTAQALEDQRAAVAAMAAAGRELEASQRFAQQVTEAVPGIVLVYEVATGAMSYGNGAARTFVHDASMPGETTLTDIIERAVHPAERDVMQAWRLSARWSRSS